MCPTHGKGLASGKFEELTRIYDGKQRSKQEQTETSMAESFGHAGFPCVQRASR